MSIDAKQAVSDLENLASKIQEGHGFCPECGIVKPDEDGCCSECGASSTGMQLDDLSADIKTVLARMKELEAGLGVGRARVKVLEMQAPGYAEIERERIIATLLSSDKVQVWLPEAGDLYPATANDLRKLFQA